MIERLATANEAGRTCQGLRIREHRLVKQIDGAGTAITIVRAGEEIRSRDG